MSNRHINIRVTHLAGALLVAFLALAASFLPAFAPIQHENIGASVHSKNGATPSWILELQTRNTRQMPVTVRNGEPSYWI